MNADTINANFVNVYKRITELETVLGKLRGNAASAPASSLQWIETVTLGAAGPIRLPSTGSFPTTYKDLIIRGKIRSNKAAVLTDPVFFTVNAVGANYFGELVYNNAATTAAAAEYRAAANWTFSIAAANAPAGVFTQIEMIFFDYGVSGITSMKYQYGLLYGTGAGQMQVGYGHGWINSSQVVQYITANVAAANNLLAGSRLAAYGVMG